MGRSSDRRERELRLRVGREAPRCLDRGLLLGPGRGRRDGGADSEGSRARVAVRTGWLGCAGIDYGAGSRPQTPGWRRAEARKGRRRLGRYLEAVEGGVVELESEDEGAGGGDLVVALQVTGASRWLPWMGVDWWRVKPWWEFQFSSWSSTWIEPPCWVLALRRRVAPWRAIRAVCVSRSQPVRILVADLGRMMRHRPCGAVSAVRFAEAFSLRGLSPWPCHGGRG